MLHRRIVRTMWTFTCLRNFPYEMSNQSSQIHILSFRAYYRGMKQGILSQYKESRDALVRVQGY